MLTHFLLLSSLTFAQGSGFQRRLFMGNPEIENVFRAGKITLKARKCFFFVANANKPKLLRNANVKLFDNHGLKQALAEELADFLTGYTKDSYSG